MLSRLLAVLFVTLASAASAQPASPHDQLARELYAEPVNIDTSSRAGSIRAAQATAKRLLEAGSPAAGISGLFDDLDDVRAHGRDERLGVNALYEGRKVQNRPVKGGR